MVHETDALEMERFYREYYKKYIRALQNGADKADRWEICSVGLTFHGTFFVADDLLHLPSHALDWLSALLAESYQTAATLFEVSKAVMISESAEVDIEVHY